MKNLIDGGLRLSESEPEMVEPGKIPLDVIPNDVGEIDSAADDQEEDLETGSHSENRSGADKKVGFYETPLHIYELCYDGTRTYFACFNHKTRVVRKTEEIHVSKGSMLAPLHDQLIQKGVVYLPVEPKQYGSERDLFVLVREFIHRYLAVSEFYERLASYYVLFSWLHDRFNTLPYLRALGDYGTGKTRFLQVIGSICYRPVFASGATTVSPIFRIIDRHRGTLILDEADFKSSGAEAEIVKILNSGYQKGIPVIRSELINNTYEPVPYEVYGPKLIATRNRYQDKALESRCLTEEMDFHWRPDVPSILPDEFWSEALELRNMLLQWRFDKYAYAALREDRIHEGIEPRLNQVMMPLASIIEDPTMLNDLREFAERYNKNIIVERGMLFEAEVLQAIVDLARGGKRNPAMKDIADALNQSKDENESCVTAKKVGWVVRNRLKLPTTEKRNVRHLEWDEEKVGKLCEKYGVVVDGC
jgi:hypothetical protein